MDLLNIEIETNGDDLRKEEKDDEEVPYKRDDFHSETRTEFLCPWTEKYPFVEDGYVFKSIKQYTQFEKAKIFGDKQTAVRILSTKDIKNQYLNGHRIKTFDESIWLLNKLNVLKRANQLKFEQNADIKQLLMSTPNATIRTLCGHWNGIVLLQLKADFLSKSNKWF